MVHVLVRISEVGSAARPETFLAPVSLFIKRTISILWTMRKLRGVLNLDMDALEKAAQQIDQFIEKRAR
jgi:hypothetical protein